MSENKDGRIRVKICGITNEQDARDAVELGADAIGFNTFPGSKRWVDLNIAAHWIRSLPPFVTKVAVMVNPTIAEAETVFRMPFIDMLQFHGTEDEKFCNHFATVGIPFIKGIVVKERASLNGIDRFATPYVLIDAYSAGEFGGTGKSISDDILDGCKFWRDDIYLLLAGGLTASNVRSAINRVRPYGVDVASGVEVSPGRKDKTLMREFILAAREGGF